jgi:hypothetical protein
MAKRKSARAKAAKAAARKSTRRTTTRRAKASSRSAKRPSAKKKATRKATRKSTRQLVARKAAARKATKTTKRVKRAASKAKAVRRAATPKKSAPAPKKKIAARARAAVQTALPLPAAVEPKAARSAAPRPKRPPTLDRARKTVGEEEPHGLPSSLDVDRSPSAARSGRKELNDKIREHTSTGPSITAGDVDADWESAESVGDEAPGGDNPTPDQDVVDDIGRALGVEYDDDEELKGGDEIAARDRHRWELDPGSSDDYEDRD